MRNKLLQQILDETPKETKIFVEKYGDLVVRINEILKEKSLNQKGFAERMGQKPSAISRWLSGSGNLTLRTIAKMEAELGVDLIQISKTTGFNSAVKSIEIQNPITKTRDKKGNKGVILKSQPKSVSFPLKPEKDAQTELFVNKRRAQKQLVA